ncbi:hypothetical protein O9993_12745 [Vibrio lentus]|nr:hypothetical protein [Vibrio lentus]
MRTQLYLSASILELRPDNYLLKLFNRETLKQRITSSLKEITSARIPTKQRERTTTRPVLNIVKNCSHSTLNILRQSNTCGSFLSKLKLYDEAKNVMKSVEMKVASIGLKLD